MSTPSQSDLDFWEFVCCSRCNLQFASEPGIPPQVPFWLTECGHVICNNHLKVDQSCAQCGTQDIQLVPLQRDMDPPMSDWFQSLPCALDGIAGAVKFQLETMARQVRYHKARCNELISRIKRETSENKSLKKNIQELTQENNELRSHLGFTNPSRQEYRAVEEPSGTPNSNRKRQMMESHRPSNHINERTASSPRSDTTPLGPDRITLPPRQQPPNFSGQRGYGDDSGSRPRASGKGIASAHHLNQRPASSRFVDHRQYAYVPPHTPQVAARQLSHAQLAPLRQFQRAKPNEGNETHAAMPPPPSSARSKEAQGKHQLTINQGHTTETRNKPQDQNLSAIRDRRKTDMGPPPLPNPHMSLGTNLQGNRVPTSFSTSIDMVSNAPPQSSHLNDSSISSTANRFITPNSYDFPPPSANSQRSFPPASSSSGPQRFVAPSTPVFGLRTPTRPRMPFVPNPGGKLG